jgi:hypothetical protein
VNFIASSTAPERHAARIAGLALLLAIVIVILANYGISFRLIVPANAVDTARNIRDNETLFRINVACNLLYAIDIVVLLCSLYMVLKHVDRNLALMAALCRMVLVLMWSITSLNMLSALRLLGDAPYLSSFAANQLESLARINLAASYDAYYVGLPFWGCASAICSYLWLKSRYIPTGLAAFGLLSSVWCVFCAVAFISFPHFKSVVDASWYDLPMLFFELVLGFWLLIKGVRQSA